MSADKDTIKNLIGNYEHGLMGKRYTFLLSDGVTLSFSIEAKDIPHLMGIRKLPLRQVQGKSALAVYNMLKDGRVNIFHVGPHKEEFKKVMYFSHIIDILHHGDAVKIVKRVGRLNSSYFLYLDNRPAEIVHLGIVQDAKDGTWHPESLLINKDRNVDAYIKDQTPVDIIEMTVTACEEQATE